MILFVALILPTLGFVLGLLIGEWYGRDRVLNPYKEDAEEHYGNRPEE